MLYTPNTSLGVTLNNLHSSTQTLVRFLIKKRDLLYGERPQISVFNDLKASDNPNNPDVPFLPCICGDLFPCHKSSNIPDPSISPKISKESDDSDLSVKRSGPTEHNHLSHWALRAFLGEKTQIEEDTWCLSADLYEAYLEFCKEKGFPRNESEKNPKHRVWLSRQSFGTLLGSRLCRKKLNRGKPPKLSVYFAHLKLRSWNAVKSDSSSPVRKKTKVDDDPILEENLTNSNPPLSVSNSPPIRSSATSSKSPQTNRPYKGTVIKTESLSSSEDLSMEESSPEISSSESEDNSIPLGQPSPRRTPASWLWNNQASDSSSSDTHVSESSHASESSDFNVKKEPEEPDWLSQDKLDTIFSPPVTRYGKRRK